jgi:hypothetical protein
VSHRSARSRRAASTSCSTSLPDRIIKQRLEFF